MYKFILEKGSKKYNCPACSNKCFVRYVKRSTNEHLDSDVGRCDRESKCGYYFTPKMYFAENPTIRNEQNQHYKKKRISRQSTIQTKGTRTQETPKIQLNKFDFISIEHLLKTLDNYDNNGFINFLIKLFPDCIDEIEKAVKDYRIGTTKDGKTVFWQIDKNMRIRTGKIIAYDSRTGKRRKDVFPNWTHAELKKRALLKQDFNLKQCFFGEHLIRDRSQKNVCIVEAEKTAVIASLCDPSFVWLAIGSKQSLKFERIKQIGRTRKIILYPDADGFDVWNKTAQTARTNGFDVTISNLINIYASDKERSNGFDLADYLISEQTGINEQNKIIASINQKIELVKSDAVLFEKFNRILDKDPTTNPDQIRQIVMNL